MKKKIIGSILTLCLLTNITCITSAASDSEPSLYTMIPAPVTSKASSQSIHISWDSSEDDNVKKYYIMRRPSTNNKGTGKWKTIVKIKSDNTKGGPENTYTDQLNSAEPQQYEYKVCTLSKDGSIDTRNIEYADETNKYTSLGTNIKMCIDPGHFGTLNNNYDYTGANGKFPYSEAKFTLKIGKALQEELKQSYGIDSYLTRTSQKISLTYNGKQYVNENLDSNNIAVRGYVAKTNDCDFFISLHTNSTSQVLKPWNQPKEINKAYVFVNNAAHTNDLGMKIANSIGINLTNYNKEVGLQTAEFITRPKNNASLFSNLSNDASNENGTVVYRKNSRGTDYYGVLRGSNEVGVQGILVEHAFHATKIMRKQAKASQDLYKNWAACDAYGIAYGFGFANSQELSAIY